MQYWFPPSIIFGVFGLLLFVASMYDGVKRCQSTKTKRHSTPTPTEHSDGTDREELRAHAPRTAGVVENDRTDGVEFSTHALGSLDVVGNDLSNMIEFRTRAPKGSDMDLLNKSGMSTHIPGSPDMTGEGAATSTDSGGTLNPDNSIMENNRDPPEEMETESQRLEVPDMEKSEQEPKTRKTRKFLWLHAHKPISKNGSFIAQPNCLCQQSYCHHSVVRRGVRPAFFSESVKAIDADVFSCLTE